MKLDYMLDHIPDTIRQHTTQRNFQPGDVVVRKGDRADHVYVITAGKLRVSNEFESGQRYTFASLEVPDLIGDLEVLAGQEHFAATNEAVTECKVLSMTAETFMHWLRIDNDFAVAVAQLLASKMYPTSNEAGRVKFQPSQERFEEYLAKRLGDIETDLFILHTSRQQIADDIGTSVKTVNRCVTKMRDDGNLSLLHGKITLNRDQQERLRKLLNNVD